MLSKISTRLSSILNQSITISMFVISNVTGLDVNMLIQLFSVVTLCAHALCIPPRGDVTRDVVRFRGCAQIRVTARQNQRDPRSVTSAFTMELKRAISEEATVKAYGALHETNRSRDKGDRL